ncbi:MAG: c-type cytochrome [Chloroflexota bacterium]
MSDDRSHGKEGRELTPRDPDGTDAGASSVTPLPEGESRDVERFSAGPRAHSVGLTEERSAQIVRQSGNARNVVFLAMLVIAIFIPVYWFYESGIPALGTESRLAQEAQTQAVTDIGRGYELYLANCARCHAANGQGGIGPPLNDQSKLYNAVTPAGGSGSGQFNPDYLDNVLTVGGRYVCGDPDSLMAVWREPGGPLDYRQVDEIIAWLTASSEVTFEFDSVSQHNAAEGLEPVVVSGWRDPQWTPEPGATPPPACWRAPDGLTAAAAAQAPATADPDVTPEPIVGGSTDAPRVINVEAAGTLKFFDEDGNQLTQIDAVEGETIEFVVDNTAGFDHNFYIGSADELEVPGGTTPVGIATWKSGVQTLTWTVEAGSETLQFACTVPGHYAPMHGDIVIRA